jgi:chromosome segregation ATPase
MSRIASDETYEQTLELESELAEIHDDIILANDTLREILDRADAALIRLNALEQREKELQDKIKTLEILINVNEFGNLTFGDLDD